MLKEQFKPRSFLTTEVVANLVDRYGDVQVAVVSALRMTSKIRPDFVSGRKMLTKVSQLWLKRGISVDRILELLELSFDSCDRYKLDVLRFYIEHTNREIGSGDTMIQILLRNYGDVDLSQLLTRKIVKEDNSELAIGLPNELIGEWMKRRLFIGKLTRTMDSFEGGCPAIMILQVIIIAS